MRVVKFHSKGETSKKAKQIFPFHLGCYNININRPSVDPFSIALVFIRAVG